MLQLMDSTGWSSAPLRRASLLSHARADGVCHYWSLPASSPTGGKPGRCSGARYPWRRPRGKIRSRTRLFFKNVSAVLSDRDRGFYHQIRSLLRWSNYRYQDRGEPGVEILQELYDQVRLDSIVVYILWAIPCLYPMYQVWGRGI